MNIEAPVFRRVEDGVGQDQAIGHHDRHIGTKSRKLCLPVFALE